MKKLLGWGFMLLFIGRVLLLPVSAHGFQEVSLDKTAQESSKSYVSDEDGCNAILLGKLEFTQYKLGQKKAANDNHDDSTFVPLICQRLISFAQHEPLHNDPD